MMNLPIEAYRNQIVEMVRNNSVSIISAETGAGKSTMVPKMLYDAGFRNIIVTQPRALAAISLANYISEEFFGEMVGNHVGYTTRFDKQINKESGILFATDGTVIASPESYIKEDCLIIIDEVHEFNLNIESILALVKKAINDKKQIKVVIMSATFDTTLLSDFFYGAPTLNVSGRCYPVEYSYRCANDLVGCILELNKEGRNVLAFLPGKQEIEDIKNILHKRFQTADLVEPPIIALHGEMKFEEQKASFKSYSQKKIVLATNVAQTSITIPDIDAVVDSGKAKVSMSVNGVDGLYLTDISEADCRQRMGRAGRTKPGIYILCSNKNLNTREKYMLPEIQRSSLDGIVLKLMSMNINPEELEFVHQPNKEDIKQAKKLLEMLGAIDENQVTKLGKEMSEIPLSPRNARIFIEARKYHVESDIAIILAIMEVNGIRSRDYFWNGNSDQCGDSDMLYELELFKYNYELYTTHDSEGKRNRLETVRFKAFQKALQITLDIYKKFELKRSFSNLEYNAEAIKRCILVGFADRIYRTERYGFTNGVDSRQMDKSSICSSYSEYIFGIPKDIEVKDRYSNGTFMLKLVTMCTKLSLSFIKETLPNIFIQKEEVSSWGKELVVSFLGEIVSRETICSLDELKNAEPENFVIKYAIRFGELYKDSYYKNQRLDTQYISSIETFYNVAEDDEWYAFLEDTGVEIIYVKKYTGKIYQRFMLDNMNVYERNVANSDAEFYEYYPGEEMKVIW